MTPWVIVAVAAGVIAAVLAGFYFAFSVTARVLGRRADGGAELDALNEAVERPPFLTLFMAAPVTAVVTAVWALPDGGVAAVLAGVGAVAMIVATVLTVAVNVPINRRLAEGRGRRGEPGGAVSGEEWSRLAARWCRSNDARLALSVLGALTLVLVPVLRLTGG
ncbi:integral membrane protein [Actinomycetales bacterium JB111]|nr:integral membrane protein [Actinomycetales bacterium JB111]